MPPAAVSPRSYLLLHTVVAVWGLTAVLGKGIDLSPTVLVAWRTGIAAVALAIVIRHQQKMLWPGSTAAIRMLLVGMLIGFHWHLFFLAGKLGHVSISLIGVATCSLWCALLEPLFHKGKRLGAVEFILSASVVLGASVIGFGNPVSWPCLGTGAAAAGVAALFSYLNNALVKHHDATSISFYEMIGACVFTIAFAWMQPTQRLVPSGWEWLWLVILSLLCTVWAFSIYIGLLRQISVFVVSLVSNLEPVWGILLAGILLGEFTQLNGYFWLGGTIVLASICCYPLWQRRRARLATSPSHHPPSAPAL